MAQALPSVPVPPTVPTATTGVPAPSPLPTSASDTSQTPAAAAATAATAPANVTIGPMATGLGGQQRAGNLNYALNISEILLSGYQSSGLTSSTNFSGVASFVSSSETHPTSFLYSGGYLLSNASGFQSSAYQNFGISQVLLVQGWNLVFADLVSYLPQNPAYGLSGVPGVGDLGTSPIAVGQVPVQSILTNSGTEIYNNTSGSVSRAITPATSASGSVSYGVQRFLGNGGTGYGLDNNQFTLIGSVNHRVDARNSFGGYYSYNRFTYGNGAATGTGVVGTGIAGTGIVSGYSFQSNGVGGEFQHLFTRQLTLSASAGPQWTSGTPSILLPTRVSVAASATLNYAQQRTGESLNYTRGSNAGSGVLAGSLSDNVNFTVQHTFSRDWSGSSSLNYGRASSLLNVNSLNVTTNSFYGGIQATRRLGRLVSAYASYNAQTQSVSNLALTQNAYSGTTHVFGFGASYAPRPIHLGRR